MGRYRKIDSRIWNDEKFRALSDDGKLVFLFALTHPHLTSLGAMRASEGGLSDELGWPIKRFRKAFGESCERLMVNYDPKACYLDLPHFIEYNGPESPNVVKSWAAALDLIPECALKNDLLNRIERYIETLPEAFKQALPEAFRKIKPKNMPNPEPEPEPEQKASKEALKASCAEVAAGDSPPEPANGGPPVITIPTNRGEEFPVCQTFVDEMQVLYPAVDVLQELRNARGWSLTHSKDRKTWGGMPKFLNAWMSREQNNPRHNATGPSGNGGSPSLFDKFKKNGTGG